MSTNKRQEIRDRVLAGITSGLAPRPAENPGAAPSPASPDVAGNPAVRSRAYIATVGQQLTEGLANKVERLEAERREGLVVLRLDPKIVRATTFANRLEVSLDAEDPEFARLKDSIRRNGQLEPIRVRPAPSDSGFHYEIVYGHRRHAAVLALDAETEGGFKLLALVDAEAVDPKRLAAAMHEENEARQAISAYEHGRMYRSWLDAGLFATQGELAEFVGKSEPTITQYIRVFELPETVLAAFGDRRVISMRWMQELSKALKDHRDSVIAAAERVAEATPRLTPEQVLKALTAGPAKAGQKSSASREEAVKIQGKVAFRIARRDGRITLKLGKGIDRQLQKELTEEIKELAEGLLAKRLKDR